MFGIGKIKEFFFQADTPMFEFSSAIVQPYNLGKMIYISESQNLQMYNKINKTYFERFWGIRLEEIKRIKHWAQI